MSMASHSIARHFQTMAQYNRIANEKLYAACAQLSDVEYRRTRAGSFGSIHALLNHILLGDRIWMERFTTTEPAITPPLDGILYHDFADLRRAREAEDARIEAFMTAPGDFFSREIGYTNNAGVPCADPAPLLAAHLFNHQTHHRGQVHVMLSQTNEPPPGLDLHRAIRPAPK